MKAHLRSPPTVTRLHQPRVEESPFVRAFISRDTRGCALAGDALLNRFPGSPHCVLTWFPHGGADLLSRGGEDVQEALPPCTASGCQTHPATSRSRGDVQAFMVMFYPDADQSHLARECKALTGRWRRPGHAAPAPCLGT
jgi:hypothetical protein